MTIAYIKLDEVSIIEMLAHAFMSSFRSFSNLQTGAIAQLHSKVRKNFVLWIPVSLPSLDSFVFANNKTFYHKKYLIKVSRWCHRNYVIFWYNKISGSDRNILPPFFDTKSCCCIFESPNNH